MKPIRSENMLKTRTISREEVEFNLNTFSPGSDLCGSSQFFDLRPSGFIHIRIDSAPIFHQIMIVSRVRAARQKICIRVQWMWCEAIKKVFQSHQIFQTTTSRTTTLTVIITCKGEH